MVLSLELFSDFPHTEERYLFLRCCDTANLGLGRWLSRPRIARCHASGLRVARPLGAVPITQQCWCLRVGIPTGRRTRHLTIFTTPEGNDVGNVPWCGVSSGVSVPM